MNQSQLLLTKLQKFLFVPLISYQNALELTSIYFTDKTFFGDLWSSYMGEENLFVSENIQTEISK